MAINSIAQALAAAFLAGPLAVDAMMERGVRLFGRRWRWLRPVAERVSLGFAGATTPRHAALVAFLLEDAGFVRACERNELEFYDLHDRITDKPTMTPVAAAASWPVPALRTAGELADWLEIEPHQLDWLADIHGHEHRRRHEPLRHYRYRPLVKRLGKIRLIEAPKPRLKQIQQRILAEILDHVPTHDAAHGFRRGRSIKTFAAPHVGRRVVLRLDLRDFFPALRVARIQAIFRTLGYPESVADLLAGLCTNTAPYDLWPTIAGTANEELRNARRLYSEPHLPQGAPTSPALANLCAYRLDARLAAFAATVGATYTRYADDLAFSGDRDFERVVGRFALHASVVAAEEGFAVNHRKTRIMREGVRQHLAGVVVNRTLNINRADFDRLKAVLTNSAQHGPASQNRDRHADFRAHLLGRISFVEMLHSSRGKKLRELFDRISW